MSWVLSTVSLSSPGGQCGKNKGQHWMCPRQVCCCSTKASLTPRPRCSKQQGPGVKGSCISPPASAQGPRTAPSPGPRPQLPPHQVPERHHDSQKPVFILCLATILGSLFYFTFVHRKKDLTEKSQQYENEGSNTKEHPLPTGGGGCDSCRVAWGQRGAEAHGVTHRGGVKIFPMDEASGVAGLNRE